MRTEECAILLITSVVVLLVFIIRGITGFGAGIILTPFLVLLTEVRQAVILTLLLNLVAGAYLFLSSSRQVNSDALRKVILFSASFSIIGAILLSAFSADILVVFLGATIILYGVHILFQSHFPAIRLIKGIEKRPFLFSALAGALSGLFQGLYGAGGPPIVIFYNETIATKDNLRATLIAYFLILDLLRCVIYLMIPIITPHSSVSLLVSNYEIRQGLIMSVPALIGASLGNRLQTQLSEGTFRRAVAIILVTTGVILCREAFSI